MAIAYKSQGAGAGTETNGAALNLPCPATVDANDILVGQVIHTGTTTAPSTPSGWTLLYGPADVGTTATARHWIFGRIADGSEDGTNVNFGTAGGTNGRAGRIYSFSGYVSGTINDVIPAASFSDIPHATDPQGPSVTTTKAGALAVACMCQDDNNSEQAIAGMSGGTWGNHQEYSNATWGPQGIVLYLNSCTPTADPGTVSGGAMVAANDESSTIGFEIRDSAPEIFIDAQPGSFTETGVAATLQRGFELNAQPGSFALTGTDATPQHGYKVTAEWGRIFISSPADKASEYLRANEFGTSLTLSAVGDAAGQCFTSLVTGPLTELAFKVFKGVATLMTVVARIYAVTGTVGVDAIPTGSPLAESTHSIVVSLSNFQELHFSFSGAFSLTQGTDYAAVLYVTEYTSSAMSPQSFDDSPHSGNAAWNDGSGWVAMSGDTHHGVYVNGVALIADRVINAEPGSLVLTGFDASTVLGRVLDAGLGVYVVTGANAGLIADRLISADPGAFVLTGFDAGLVIPAAAFEIDAAPGTFSVAGDAAGLVADRVINGEPAAFSVVGFDAVIVAGYMIGADPGSIAIVGTDAALVADRILSANPGAFTLTGVSAELVFSGGVAPAPIRRLVRRMASRVMILGRSS